jgi:uncharacterized FlaG/YvyC family protein
MDITAIGSTAIGAHAPVPAVATDKAAERRDVVQAVKTVNGTEMFGAENELLFQRDSETNRFVVRVVNRKTREVLSQVPEEYVLRIAEDLKKMG